MVTVILSYEINSLIRNIIMNIKKKSPLAISLYLSNIPRSLQIYTFLFFMGLNSLQATTYHQSVHLKNDRISIRNLFKEIKLQLGYDVLWQASDFDDSQYVEFKERITSLSQIIKACQAVQKQNTSWSVVDKSIVITKVPDKRVYQDSLIYSGIITDENGKPMGGATIKISGSSKSTFTNSEGLFKIYARSKDILSITYVGYLIHDVTLSGVESGKSIIVKMIPGYNNLGEVSIVSTGYQDVPKERATGSFEVITKEQLQHSTDPNILRRLDGITTSMNFNNNLVPINSSTSFVSSADPSRSPLARLTIRGKNTLNPIQTSSENQSGRVLVVIDGIASPYPIDNVNPNDVESITVLKDAAAASIWGSRAANGVIVVKTKRGNYSQPLNISFNSNFNLTDKLNLFSKQRMSVTDFIDAQIFQFYASGTQVNPPTVSEAPMFISPVAEILGQVQNGALTGIEANSLINNLRTNDVRKDFDRYVLRKASTQTYSLGINGGGAKVAYQASFGYDKALDNSIASNNDRLTLNGNTSFKLLKTLEVSVGVNYTIRRTHSQAPENSLPASIGVPYYPYTRLTDESGVPVAIPYTYNQDFLDLLKSTYGTMIQDLSYNPLANVNDGYYKFNVTNLNFNLNAAYKISNALALSILYNYGTGTSTGSTLYKKNSFYVRNLITLYTDPSGNLAIPNQGILSNSENPNKNHSARTQLSYNKVLNNKHTIDAISGIELTQASSLFHSNRYYGYDSETLINDNQLDYRTQFQLLFSGLDGSFATVPYLPTVFTDTKVRTFSAYANGAYTFNGKYTFSGSIRKDMSSEFGFGTNKGGTPFYSFGLKWDLSKENFYPFSTFIPAMQFRTTFGYNGNVNPLISARQLIDYSFGLQNNNLFSASTNTLSATNPLLRPEKTGILNAGVDMAFKNNRVSVGLEYYDKRTTDLIASNFLDPSLGFSNFSYNTANIHAWGADISINSLNLTMRKFSWRSNFLFSYNRVKVSKLYSASAKTATDVVSGSPNYNEGADLSRLYAYKWAGLDPLSGLPRGFYNGQPILIDNASYLQVVRQPLSTAKYFGSSVPVYFGSIRNTLQYGIVSISANILYKLGYFFRRPNSDVVNYSALFNSILGNNTIQGAEFNRRWQRPGDETRTNVPGMSYPAKGLSDTFYAFSEKNVLKADHIRLQEINLGVSLGQTKWALKNPRLYANVTNLGILWRANRAELDPDVADYPNPKTYSLGLSANF